VLALFSRTPRTAEPAVLRVLDAVGGQLAQFLQRHDAERRVAEQATDLRVLSRVAHVLATQTDMDAARSAICEGTREVAAAHAVVLWELASGGRALEVSAAAGIEAGAMRIELGRGCVAGMAFASGIALFSGDLRADPRVPGEWIDAVGGASAYFAPVLQDGRAAGVLGVMWREPRTELPARLTELLDLLAGEAAVTVHRTALMAQLNATARTDPLTGLPNRRVWDEDLARELSRARRHGGRLCLVMLDLDHFKAYNDRHGHQAGDQLLKSTAAAWRDTLRPTDTLARYGGEEFALLLPHTEHADAARAVTRLLALVPLGQSASAGIAAWDTTETGDALVARADAALYAAKAAGRSRAVFAP
jgi:diguanylate cyclase (GGDEF)-like protein